jgi:hypothetical protein
MRRAITGEVSLCRRERSDRGDLLGRHSALAGGRRAPVVEGQLAARSPARQPLAHGALTDAEIGADLGCWLLLIEHARDHQESTTRRRAGILVQVHPGLQLGG